MDSSEVDHGFLYNRSTLTYTTLNNPLASPDGKINGTRAYGISGNNIVGAYLDSSGQQNGFLYDGTSYTTLDDPLGTNGTYAQGISGNLIVGYLRGLVGGRSRFRRPRTVHPCAPGLSGLAGAVYLRRRRARAW